jgi:hypothetical protein
LGVLVTLAVGWFVRGVAICGSNDPACFAEADRVAFKFMLASAAFFALAVVVLLLSKPGQR